VARRQPFTLVYDAKVKSHLEAIARSYHSLIRRTIEEQLRYEPDRETRNRKPLRRPSIFGTAWELRFGPSNRFRVFYQPVALAREVHILAIGVKIGERLFIGTEEFAL
jgi:hypothetical protein